MLRTTTTKSAKNSLLDEAEDAEVGNGTSSTTRSGKNLPLDIAEDTEVDGNDDGGDDETVKRSSSQKPSGPRGYLTSLHSKKMSFP